MKKTMRRRWWITIHPHGEVEGLYDDVRDARREAEAYVKPCEVIMVVEVAPKRRKGKR